MTHHPLFTPGTTVTIQADLLNELAAHVFSHARSDALRNILARIHSHACVQKGKAKHDGFVRLPKHTDEAKAMLEVSRAWLLAHPDSTPTFKRPDDTEGGSHD